MDQEFRRIVPAADTAVLFIHGIVGTPRHFDDLILLLPDTVSVHNLLLAGHGGSARDFAHASMTAWELQVEAAVAALAETHSHIYLVAHSMGALLSIEAAAHHKEVEKLFLLAVPLRIALTPAMARNSWKVYRSTIAPDDHAALAAQRCCGVAQTKNPLPYLGWIPRFLELFSKIRAVRKLLPKLTTPSLAAQSMKDELVSPRAMDDLRQNPHITLLPLPHSGHYYYPPADKEALHEAFTAFLTP